MRLLARPASLAIDHGGLLALDAISGPTYTCPPHVSPLTMVALLLSRSDQRPPPRSKRCHSGHPALCHGPRRGAVTADILYCALVPPAHVLLLRTSGARVFQKAFGIFGSYGASQRGTVCRAPPHPFPPYLYRSAGWYVIHISHPATCEGWRATDGTQPAGSASARTGGTIISTRCAAPVVR